MEHSANSCSPSPSNASATNRNAKTPFLTPCRRMGLARKSPAASSNWHANKSPGTVSPYKSPLKLIQQKDMMHSEHDNMQSHVTPTRVIRTFNRPLSKRLKTNHSSPQSCNEREKNSSAISNVSQFNEQTDTSKIIVAEGLENITETNNRTEVVLPQGDITEDTIKQVRKRIKEKEEKVKDLNVAHLYKKKHDVNTLQKLIQTWLQGCQAALQELHAVLLNQGHQFSIEELLNQLNIPHELVKYRRDTEDFESN